MSNMEDEPAPEEKRPLRILPLQSAIIGNAILQGVVLLFSAMIMDGGFIGRMWFQAMVAYWLMTGWLLLRRGNALTTVDAWWIRMGFFLWLGASVIVEKKVNALYHGGFQETFGTAP